MENILNKIWILTQLWKAFEIIFTASTGCLKSQNVFCPHISSNVKASYLNLKNLPTSIQSIIGNVYALLQSL